MSRRWGERGRHDDALECANEAVKIRRRQVETDAERWSPNLAFSLDTLAGALADVGRNEEALAAAEEGIALYRSAPPSDREVGGDFALGLANLAIRLARVKRQDDAVIVARESVDAYRELAEQYPDSYASQLAQSLSTLSSCARGGKGGRGDHVR